MTPAIPVSSALNRKHFRLVHRGLDVAPMLAELDAAPELWDAHKARTEAAGTPHGGSRDIWVRYNDAAPYTAGERPWGEFNSPHVPIWYPAARLLPSLPRVAMALMGSEQGEMLCGVLVTRIPPGGGINRHTDPGWHAAYTTKFYLALKSAPGSKFIAHPDGEESEALEPEPGDIWEFDNSIPHEVRNDSDQERIMCIICIRRFSL